jgi:hypothetical protein
MGYGRGGGCRRNEEREKYSGLRDQGIEELDNGLPAPIVFLKMGGAYFVPETRFQYITFADMAMLFTTLEEL